MTLFTRAANHAAIAPMFAQKFGREPLSPTDPDAIINDLIFARMIDPDWTTLERRLVDKITAKEEAARLCPGLRVAATLATVDMVAVASPTALYDRLRGLIGTDAIAKPSQASGGTVFLRNVSGPAELAELHAGATTDYAAVMREMQYAGLPRRVIVEALIPTQDGRPPDDFKFHCVKGAPLLVPDRPRPFRHAVGPHLPPAQFCADGPGRWHRHAARRRASRSEATGRDARRSLHPRRALRICPGRPLQRP